MAAVNLPVNVELTSENDSIARTQGALDGEDRNGALKLNIGEAFSLQFMGYAQAHYDYTSEDGKSVNDFNLRRVILMAKAQFTPRLWAFIMVDAANTTYAKHLQEYYAQYDFAPQFKLRMGQFKQPFMLENIISVASLSALNLNESTRYFAAIAGDPLYGNMAGRDLGLMATGDLFRARDGHYYVNYSAGVFNGAGLNVRDNNKHKDFVAMLNVRPTASLTISASCIAGKGNARDESIFNPDVTAGEDYSRNRWSTGVEFKHRILNVRGEWAWGKDRKVKSTGGYVEAVIHTLPKLDLVLDYDYINRNTALSRAEQELLPSATRSSNYLVGLQYWIYKRCRVASQYIYSDRYTGPDAHQWVTQVQVAF